MNKISFEYRQYKNILKKLERGLSLSDYLKNDYKIILKNVSKLKIEFIYNINENLKKYIDKNLTKKNSTLKFQNDIIDNVYI